MLVVNTRVPSGLKVALLPFARRRTTPPRTIHDGECSSEARWVVEVRTKDVLAPAVPLGVLLPKQRIRGSRAELVEVIDAERPHHNQLSYQGRLAIQPSSPSSSHSRHVQSPS